MFENLLICIQCFLIHDFLSPCLVLECPRFGSCRFQQLATGEQRKRANVSMEAAPFQSVPKRTPVKAVPECEEQSSTSARRNTFSIKTGRVRHLNWQKRNTNAWNTESV